MFSPVPKPSHKRRKPTRKKRGEFDEKTRQAITERDEGLCRVCKRPAGQIHHIKFKSSGGRGVFSNGMLVCQKCHADIHQNNAKAKFWQSVFAGIYGPNFYKDTWDHE